MNNHYKVDDIDQIIRRQLHRHFSSDSHTSDRQENARQLKLFYKGSMSTAYKSDEKVLRSIVRRNCTPIEPYNEVKLVI